MPATDKHLNVFLCHSSQDKPVVRKLYQLLLKYRNLEPWLDEKKILPGQDWDMEIRRALRGSDVIIICLSKNSVTKEGYVQKEIKFALDIAAEKPEGVIFLIPLLLDDCKVPDSLSNKHWVNYYENVDQNHKLLIKALDKRAETLGFRLTEYEYHDPFATPSEPKDLYKFIKIPDDESLNYPFWISKYPIANLQYERFLNSGEFENDMYWTDFPLYDHTCQYVGLWTKGDIGESRANAFKEKPRYWEREDFGKKRKYAPVVAVNWFGANAYCKWLFKHWLELPEGKNSNVRPELIRLPTELEWIKAAGGNKPKNRFPWDKKGRSTRNLDEIRRHANLGRGYSYYTSVVDKYPDGASPYGVMDMAGNAGEWQANFYSDKARPDKTPVFHFAIRGGWFGGSIKTACLSGRESFYPRSGYYLVGFRVVLLPHT